MSSPRWSLGPNNIKPLLGRRSIMMLKVSHKFARANQEKISANILYCTAVSIIATRGLQRLTHKRLDVEEEHADDAMAGAVQPTKVHDGILRHQVSNCA